MSQINVDNIRNRLGGAIGAPSGIVVTGVSTFSGDVSIGGTLTYEDVTNIDAVGVITARSDVSIADKIVHTGDTNTAIRFPAADTFTVETGGSERVRVTSGGNIGVPGATGTDYSLLDGMVINTADGGAGLLINSSSSSHNAYLGFSYGSGSGTSHADQFSAYIGRVGDNTLILGTNNIERLRISSGGQLLKGHTSSESMLYTGGIQVQGTNSSTSAITVKSNQADSGGPALVLGKSRGALGGTTVVQNDDQLGSIYFNGADGTDTNTAAAEIRGAVDGTPGSNDMPGRLIFSTTSDGASSPTERLRITSAGNVRVPDNGKFTCGAGDDLKIYHDGSANYLAGNDIRVVNNAVTETMAKFINGGAAELYHNDSKKFETTATGVTVPGIIVDRLGGDIRRAIQTTKTSAYTLVEEDTGRHVYISTGGVTVPNNVLVAGAMVTIVNNSGSNQTITQGSGMTMYYTADATSGNRTLAGRGVCTILFASGSQSYISGGGLS